jgi:cephalosporin hydroxylase
MWLAQRHKRARLALDRGAELAPRAAFNLAAAVFAPGPAQNPDEILPLIARATAEKPRVICEIGTQDSGNLFLLARLLQTASYCVAVDLEFRNSWRAKRMVGSHCELRFIRGSSQSHLTFARVRNALKGRPVDLLFIDGDHSYSGAMRDFVNYRTLVRPGGLIAFHDIVPDHSMRFGTVTAGYAGDVPQLWVDLREHFDHQEFIADPTQDGRGIGVLVHDAAWSPGELGLKT